MKKENFNENLKQFLKEGTCSYVTNEVMKNKLIENGYQELFEEDIWELESGNYFVSRNDSTIIAFQIGKNYQNSFNIITTHIDTPSLFLKPENEIFENGYLKCNVSLYGGLLNYGWLDRPLSLSGKIITKKDNTFTTRIIDYEDPLFVIPSVAIHLNDKANTNLDLNTQTDLIPIINCEEEKDIIRNLIQEKFNIKEDIIDYDLHLYNIEEPYQIGLNHDLLLAPRIDNLTCTYAGLEAFLNSDNQNNINILCAFNSEEIGSNTKEGADSNFLLDTLKKIAGDLKIEISPALYNSFIINADNIHAVHPNHPELADPTNKVYLNKGVVISKEMVSSTDALSSSIFKSLCQNRDVPYQYFTSRNDSTSGSTLACINLTHLSVTSIDVCLPQLAMHSSYECVGMNDIYSLYEVFEEFYNTSIERKEKSTKLI